MTSTNPPNSSNKTYASDFDVSTATADSSVLPIAGKNALLGTIARIPSPSFKCAYSVEDLIGDSTLMSFALQSAARRLLFKKRSMADIEARLYPKQERVCGCYRMPIPIVETVDLIYSPTHQRARFGGLQRCKSVWMCQVCARVIGERRREALKQSTAQWRHEGGIVAHAAFTLRHHIDDKLPDMLKIIRRARSLMYSGKTWDKFASRWGIRHSVKSLENTHSYKNGHHPHKHALFYLMPGVATCWQVWTDELTEQFEAELRVLWQKRIRAAGGDADYEHGCQVSDQNAYIDEYIAKFGYEPVRWGAEDELTRQGTKLAKNDLHRSMKQLLFDYLMGDAAAGQVWKEFALAFKGERQLFTSPGFGDYFGVKDLLSPEGDGEEQPEVKDVTLAKFDVDAWREMLNYGARQGREIRAELLNVAASAIPDRVGVYLEKLAIEMAARLKPSQVESTVTTGASHIPPEGQPPAAVTHRRSAKRDRAKCNTEVLRNSLPLFNRRGLPDRQSQSPPAAAPPGATMKNEPDVNTE